MKNKNILPLILLIAFGSHYNAKAQIWKDLGKKVEKKIEQKASQRIERKIDKTIDKGLDKAEQTPEELAKAGKSGDKQSSKTGEKNEGKSNSPAKLGRYSKFSFIQGEQIIAYDDFSQDAVGDLPASWVSSGTSEIVKLEGIPGKWVWFNKTKGNFIPTYLKDFPENFTLEFDMMYDFNLSQNSFKRNLTMVFTDMANPEANLNWVGDGDYFNLQKLSNNYFGFTFTASSANGGPYIVAKKVSHQAKGLNFNNQFLAKHIINSSNNNTPFHVSVARMGKRIQLFINEEKVFDLTNAFEANVNLKGMRFYVSNHTETDNYYVSNFRYAVGKPDIRNKILEKGSYTTSAITFASASANLNPESYAVLKEIASALNSQPQKGVTIIGHTDADGEESFNQALSLQRAQAVKQALQQEFEVKNNISVLGKGEKSPIDKNNTQIGKANNRRVEFVLK